MPKLNKKALLMSLLILSFCFLFVSPLTARRGTNVGKLAGSVARRLRERNVALAGRPGSRKGTKVGTKPREAIQ